MAGNMPTDSVDRVVRIFGIRHHGPGSARSLVASLNQFDPTTVLIEGPPDANSLLPLAAEAGMTPPVALMIYDTERPGRAIFYPFAIFSPEWQAIQWALRNQRPVRFIDLPGAAMIPPAKAESSDGHTEAESTEVESPKPDPVVEDPIGVLAQAAGCEDRESWWEHVVEQRQDPTGVFAGVMEAMASLREGREIESEHEAKREAHMRRCIREEIKSGQPRIAVVCGAWHAPALDQMPTASSDNALLKGLPRAKMAAAWIPWTHSRLGYRSGYGAGVDSPGWYAHLWSGIAPADEQWISRAARLLRTEGMDAPVAGVIEAVRTAHSLAALRNLPAPGLAELRESMLAVLCNGERVKLAVIREQLEVGADLGSVPESAPQVPLARDLEALQRRLRLKVSASPEPLSLDLRKELDRSRSHLLHRLSLLGIPWGHGAQDSVRNRGTFRESWELNWQPEMAILIVEASVHGNTIEAAATAKAMAAGRSEERLDELSKLLDLTLLAELPDATKAVLQGLQTRSALSDDAQGLLAALPPLARIAKYGSVRQLPTEQIMSLFGNLLERGMAGLPLAAARVNDDAAQELRRVVTDADEAVTRAGSDGMIRAWREQLSIVTNAPNCNPMLRGACLMLLIRASVASQEEVARLLSRELSPSVPAATAASWLEGLLDGSAATLIHRDDLLPAVDRWLCSLSEEALFTALPLLRRSLSSYSSGERGALSRRLAGMKGDAVAEKLPSDVGGDTQEQSGRISRSVLAAVGRMIGVEFP